LLGSVRHILTSTKVLARGSYAWLLAALACGAGCHPQDGADLENREAARGCDGDRWVAGPDDEAAIAGCAAISGNLSITGNELTKVSLPVLTRVDGFLSIWGSPGLTHASLPQLARVGGFAEVSFNQALASLDLTHLASVNERDLASSFDLAIRDNALTSCEASALAERLAGNGFRGTAQIEGDGTGCRP
jgi:hypothetical protein